MQTARRVGIRTGGHVPNEVGIGHALESGQGTIEHLDGYDAVVGFGEPMPDELIKQLALETRESGAWSTPTMSIVRSVLGLDTVQQARGQRELQYLPQVQVDTWEKLYEGPVSKGIRSPERAVTVERNRERLLEALNDVGAPILLGSDTPNLFQIPGFAIRAELIAMQGAGTLIRWTMWPTFETRQE